MKKIPIHKRNQIHVSLITKRDMFVKSGILRDDAEKLALAIEPLTYQQLDDLIHDLQIIARWSK